MWNKPSFSSDQPHAKPRRHHSEYQKDQEKVEKCNTNLDQGGMSKTPQARVQNGVIEKQTSRKGENRRTGPNDPNFNRLSSCVPAPRFHSADDRVRGDGGRTVSRLLRRRRPSPALISTCQSHSRSLDFIKGPQHTRRSFHLS